MHEVGLTAMSILEEQEWERNDREEEESAKRETPLIAERFEHEAREERKGCSQATPAR